MVTETSTCNCLGKLEGCTCDGRCACSCTCPKLMHTDDDGTDTVLRANVDGFLPPTTSWMDSIDPYMYEGQAVHRTKKGKGATAQAIARDRLRKLPPNCS